VITGVRKIIVPVDNEEEAKKFSGKRASVAPITVALATCREMPHLDPDTRHLIAPLAAHDVTVKPVVWDDSTIDWSRFDLVVVRSRWAACVPRLANDVSTLAWNTDKRYLINLAERGIPVVPTSWIEPGDYWMPPRQGLWVVKPAVSLASLDAGRYRLEDAEERRLAMTHVRRLQAVGRTVMLQPYVQAIETCGETSLVYFGGVFSHAVRKAAVLKGPDDGVDRRFVPDGGLRLCPVKPTMAQVNLAERVLAAVPGGPEALLYARVDLVASDNGTPILMELELTEPQLYFGRFAGSAEQMAAVIAGRARNCPSDDCRRSARIRRRDANEAPLDHAIEVTGPRRGNLADGHLSLLARLTRGGISIAAGLAGAGAWAAG
jgi:hypothetical protein